MINKCLTISQLWTACFAVKIEFCFGKQKYCVLRQRKLKVQTISIKKHTFTAKYFKFLKIYNMLKMKYYFGNILRAFFYKSCRFANFF